MALHEGAVYKYPNYESIEVGYTSDGMIIKTEDVKLIIDHDLFERFLRQANEIWDSIN